MKASDFDGATKSITEVTYRDHTPFPLAGGSAGCSLGCVLTLSRGLKGTSSAFVDIVDDGTKLNDKCVREKAKDVVSAS